MQENVCFSWCGHQNLNPHLGEQPEPAIFEYTRARESTLAYLRPSRALAEMPPFLVDDVEQVTVRVRERDEVFSFLGGPL